MQKKSALLCIAILLLQAVSVQAIPQQQPEAKSFMQFCQQKNSLPLETKRTIDVLLKKVATQNCKIANSKLRNLTELNLPSSKNID